MKEKSIILERLSSSLISKTGSRQLWRIVKKDGNYYPFGLTMAAISDQALKPLYYENKTRFQGQELQNKEFSDGSGLEMYSFKYRMDDPQIGRFWQIDPLADKYVYNSTYAFSEDKVTTHVELEGREAEYIFARAWEELKGAIQSAADKIDKAITDVTKGSASTENASQTTGPVTVTNSTNVTVTTETSTNLGGNASYVMNHNTNQGNPEPFTKTQTNVKVSDEQKTDIKTPQGTLTNKTSVDNNGVVTTENGVKTNVNLRSGVQVTIGTNVSQSSDGKQSVTISGSTVGDTKGKANVTYSTNGSNRSVEVSIGGEKKIGKTTTTTSAGVRINF